MPICCGRRGPLPVAKQLFRHDDDDVGNRTDSAGADIDKTDDDNIPLRGR